MRKQQNMRIHRSVSCFLTFVLILSMAVAMSATTFAAGGLEMSTAYPGLTVKAGDELGFSLDFYNSNSSGINAALSIQSIPDGWEGYFEGNGSEISHVYVKSGDNASAATFHVTV